MSDKKKPQPPEPSPKRLPEHKPALETEPEPNPESPEADSSDIMSVITSDMWKKGFYIRVQKHQTAARGLLLTWQTERITSPELETQELPDVLFDKYGNGVYRPHLYTLDGKELFKNKKFQTAVGDVSDQRPNRAIPPTNVNQPSNFGRGAAMPAKSSQEKVADRSDVQDVKAKVEMARAELDLAEIEEKKKALKGGDQNSSTERMVTNLAQSFEKAILQLTAAFAKPADNGNAKLEAQLAKLEQEIRDGKSRSEQDGTTKLIIASMESTNKLMMESMKTMTEQQRTSETKYNEMMLKLITTKQPGGEQMNFMQMIQVAMKMLDYRRENMDEIIPADIRPEKEEGIIQQIANGFIGLLNKLNEADPNLIARMFSGAGAPQPNPAQPNKTEYTEEQLNEISRKYAEEVLEKYKKERALKGKKVIDAEVVTDVAADKKERVNKVLKKVLSEIKLKPNMVEWVMLAYGTLPRDVLEKIAAAKTEMDVFAVISELADPDIVSQLKSEILPGGLPDSANVQWLSGGIKILRDMIAYGVDENGNILYPKEK
ncbi:MAG: hypothetical protein V1701_02880 [Planctomycetota bacterium]